MKAITKVQHEENLKNGKYSVANLLSSRGDNYKDQVMLIEQITKTKKRFYRDLLVIDFNL
jgi:hypothetical protein